MLPGITDRMAMSLFGVAILLAAIFTYLTLVPRSSEQINREMEDAKRLGYHWGAIETAETSCPQLIINAAVVRQLLAKTQRSGENSRSAMMRMSSSGVWYDAYLKGESETKALRKSNPGKSFCDAIAAAYGPSGTRTPGLLKARAEGEVRARFF